MSKNARILTRVITASVIIAAFAACDIFSPGPSGPGELQASLMSPNATEGAAVLEVTGGVGLGSVTTDHGQAFYQADGGTTRIVIILDDPGQITFQIRVRDVAELPSVTVVQVADGSNELRTSLAGYDVEWIQLADSDLDLHRGVQ